jgi:predicted neuraminidase
MNFAVQNILAHPLRISVVAFFTFAVFRPEGWAADTWKLIAPQPGLVKNEFLFDAPPVPECHASTIVETTGGVLMAAWFAGTREGNKDVGIWLSVLEGTKWSAPKQVADGVQKDQSRHPCWNPVLFQPKEGPLMLFYKVGPSPSSWWGMLMTSGDDGKTWSEARRLPDDIFGPIKNKPVQLADGRILCPSSTEGHGWRVHFEWSMDNGKTWERTAAVNDGKAFGAIQPSILLHQSGRLQALGRTRQQTVFQIWSEDSGKTWGPMKSTVLPNPNSGIDAVTLRDGRQLIVYNHTTKGRTPLNVAVSRDGENWEPALVLENEPGEYSYPAVIQGADGRVHITYTWKRLRIKHAIVEPGRLASAPLR